MENDVMYIWSDGWCIEPNKVWLIDAVRNILLGFDLKLNRCEQIISIPGESNRRFRLNPRCVKYENNIFCMPSMSNNIWVYNVVHDNFLKIRVQNPDKVRLEVYLSEMYDNKMYAVSYGLGQIIEIDPVKKDIINYYELGGEKLIPDSVRVGNEVYSLSISGKIYCFNMEIKKSISYMLPDIGKKFYGLCFDGKKFWMGGYCKEVYVWDKEENVITTIDSFPEEFGIYNFGYNSNGKADCFAKEYKEAAFVYVITAGEYIWFIPFLTNKIIYVNRNSYELRAFEVKEENETIQSILQNELKQKYVLEYVVDNRYIGLFSAKNRCILEIDAELLKYRLYDFDLGDEYLWKCAEILRNVFNEDYAVEKEMYEKVLLQNSRELSSMGKNIVGANIYQRIMIDV